MGVSVVNALSSRLEVDISRDGYEWFQSYDHSMPGTLKQGEATKKTGTDGPFWADSTIFETTTYDFETVPAPAAGDGVPEQGPDHHPVRRAGDAEQVVDEVVSDVAEAPKSAEEKAAEARVRTR